MNNIQIGILGYGNLGRGVELAISQQPDMELTAIFTRRNPAEIQPSLSGVPIYNVKDVLNFKNSIDVMILCGGSSTDLDSQSPAFASHFNIVDSFDTHPEIPRHFKSVNTSALLTNHTAIVSAGWDPGLFSINRLLAESILPLGHSYTFWGKGVSQGHSDALRRIEGVANAIQYTIPLESAMEAVRRGDGPAFTPRQMHTRECYVALLPDADPDTVRDQIVHMPSYFADYDTTVHFVSQEELQENHYAMPHGGFIQRSGTTGSDQENCHIYEFSLKLDSNPQFTANVLACYARSAYRLAAEGSYGAKTVLEIPPAYLSSRSIEQLRAEIL
ncbi:diaminopimelate dehydrogenase [Aminipila butyrica]|uniref:Meso-diaminopimelate D-dehydrogenase n=1 Tax=Aminipila butyrica TaxID=433296 RepID=A0A858BV03_9FIRM|nr:diaminopimelate dehydrogenase [Aminipila butyrica]QIB69891.1 diaminopimelate dehydrogenase [Aminipila butyrica]